MIGFFLDEPQARTWSCGALAETVDLLSNRFQSLPRPAQLFNVPGQLAEPIGHLLAQSRVLRREVVNEGRNRDTEPSYAPS